MFPSVTVCASTEPTALCSGQFVQPVASWHISAGTACSVAGLHLRYLQKCNSSIVLALQQKGRHKTIVTACQADTPTLGLQEARGSDSGTGAWRARPLLGMRPPHRHRACMPGAAQGSQPSVTLEGGGGHGELIAVFLLDMCLKVPVGRNELRQGSVGEKHNSSVVRSPLTNPYVSWSE